MFVDVAAFLAAVLCVARLCSSDSDVLTFDDYGDPLDYEISNNSNVRRMYNGGNAPDLFFTSIVWIDKGPYDGCGGSRLSLSAVLTAASCIQGRTKNDIKVVYGCTDLEHRNCTRADVAEILIREGFVPKSGARPPKNNIALIFLKETIDFLDFPQIPLKPITGEGIIAGWGAKNPLYERQELPTKVLQWAYVDVTAANDCKGRQLENEICYRKKGVRMGYADVGGPVFFSSSLHIVSVDAPLLVGIMSYQFGCGQAQPEVIVNRVCYGVATSVKDHLLWIERELRHRRCGK